MDIKMDIGNIAKFYGPLPRNTSSRADCIESGLVRLWTFPPPLPRYSPPFEAYVHASR